MSCGVAVSDVRTGRFERSLSAVTAAGAAITAAEIYLSHDGASFGNKMMWWPVVVVPTAIPAGVAAVFSARAARTVLPLTSAAIVINGVQGTYLHWRGIAQRPGGWTRYNMEAGPPMFAPLLASLVGGMGLVAAVLRRETVRPAMTFRPRPRRAVTPQGRGRFPGFDVLDQSGVWDDVTAGVVLARLAPPNDLGFFTQDERAVAEPLLDLLLAQDTEPRVPVLALIDTRLAIGETDGWHYDDLPEDGRGVAGHPPVPGPGRRGTAPPAVRPAAAGRAGGADPGRAGPRAPRRAVARLPRRPGVEPVDPVRLHRVLFPPLGMERDRVPRTGLPPWVPEPRDQRPGAVGNPGPGRRRPGALHRPHRTGPASARRPHRPTG